MNRLSLSTKSFKSWYRLSNYRTRLQKLHTGSLANFLSPPTLLVSGIDLRPFPMYLFENLPPFSLYYALCLDSQSSHRHFLKLFHPCPYSISNQNCFTAHNSNLLLHFLRTIYLLISILGCALRIFSYFHDLSLIILFCFAIF